VKPPRPSDTPPMLGGAKPPRPSDTPPMLGGAKPPRPSDTPPMLGGAKPPRPSDTPPMLGGAEAAQPTPLFLTYNFIFFRNFELNHTVILYPKWYYVLSLGNK